MEKEKSIMLEITTPRRRLLQTEVESLTVATPLGPDSIMLNHAPMVTVLEPGVLVYHKDGREFRLALGNGFMEVANNLAEILVDRAELPEDIDRARAEEALHRAEKRLYGGEEGVDMERARQAWLRAMARLQALK